MTAQIRTKPDDTRARIMDTAEALFRRLGYAKTAVADIAGELKMSPANVYRFFPSKNAIIEAICQRCLGDLEDTAWAVARSRGSAAERLERLDPRESSRLMMISLVNFCHPVLVAQYLRNQGDLETDARATIRFLLRAITPRT